MPVCRFEDARVEREAVPFVGLVDTYTVPYASLEQSVDVEKVREALKDLGWVSGVEVKGNWILVNLSAKVSSRDVERIREKLKSVGLDVPVALGFGKRTVGIP
ncbi:hypothetical protein DRO51_01505, partial [Candidatus Bathyarchaeota archaeon]